jgi:Holliday junction resolvase RusA-like endonuclease
VKHQISFFVEGEPQGQPRHRSRVLKVKPRPGKKDYRLHSYADTTRFFMRVVRAAAAHAPAEPLTGPIRVDLLFMFSRGPGVPFTQVWMDKKPDRDNLDKGVLDALTRKRFWTDDALVCSGKIDKQYCTTGTPGVFISIWRLPPNGIRFEE